MYLDKNKLLVWDWKFRCYFESEVADSVLEFMSNLYENEQRVYSKLLNYYTSHFSFQQLLDAIDNNTAKEREYIDKAHNNIFQMYTMPKILFKYYKNKILDSNYVFKNELLTLLRKSVSIQNRDNFAPNVLVPTFGIHFVSSLRDYVKKTTGLPKTRNITQKIPVPELRTYCLEKLKENENNSRLIRKYGKFHNSGYSIKFTKDIDHYGEYWHKQLTNDNQDMLILAVNKSSICQRNLNGTLIHEVYPGHSHFYDRVIHREHAFDHGAMAVIEGWATFCEYETNNKSGLSFNYKLLVKHLLRLDKPKYFEESCSKIYEIMLAETGSKSIALSSLISATQYRGYLESYYIGALWLLTYFKKTGKTPSYFLNKLAKRNVGEYFNIYYRDLVI